MKQFTALLCTLLVTAPLPAQVGASPDPAGQQQKAAPGGPLKAFRYREEPPINLSNSGRLDSLLRAGKIYLSLQDAIALALENNLDIELSRYGPRLADADILRARTGSSTHGVSTGIYSNSTQSSGLSSALSSVGAAGTTGGPSLPSLDSILSTKYTWQHATTPQTSTFVTGTNSLRVDSQVGNLSFQKGFLTGTSFQVDFENTPYKSNSTRSAFNPSVGSSLGVTVTQKLLQGFGTAVNNRYIRIAKNDRHISDLVFKQQVITTVASVIGLYWDLVSYNETVKVKQQALALAEKLYNDNKKQVEIGTLAPIEIVRAEAEVASSQQALTVAETNVLQQETIIKNALSRTGIASPAVADARIVATDVMRMPQTEAIEPMQDLVNRALDSRPEIAQTRLQVENTKISLQGTKSSLRPSLDLALFATNNGLSGTAAAAGVDSYFIGGYGKVLSQIFRRNFPDYGVTLNFSVPLSNRAARANMISDQLALRQQQIREQQLVNQIRVGVVNALIAVQQARASYEAAAKARVLQEETLDAEQKKYNFGASTIFLVIQAQRDLADARSTEVTALSTYSKARVDLDMATGQVLTSNNVSVDEAMAGRVSRAPSALPESPK